MTDLDALKAAVKKMQDIAADFEDFDGDRRGIAECLSDAEWAVAVGIAKSAPSLLDDAALGRRIMAGDDAALERFAEWFRKNYPGPDTVIHKPDWHAPKIFRAALAALKEVG